MRKLLGVLALIVGICVSVTAKEITTVCASHILVPSEMDAIKLNIMQEFIQLVRLVKEVAI